MLELIHTIAGIVRSGGKAVCATIVGHAGSAPRGAGSKMLVWPDGAIAGSVGGGVLEADVMRRASGLFESGEAAIMEFDLTGEQAAGAGMICGGAVTVLLELIGPGAEAAEVFEQAASVLEKGRRAVLLTILDKSGQDPSVQSRLLLTRDNLAGTGPEAPADVLDFAQSCESASIVESGGLLYAVEPLVPPSAAVIIGAGHVGLYTAELAAKVGFRTVIMDDRADFANRRRFPDAAEIRVVKDFTHCFDGLEIDESSFIVILTRGHVHDKQVLAAALTTGAGYVGMIGSRRKRDVIYRALVQEGLPRAELERVHSPIGLSIGAETPQEIAVSIVAQMIEVRAGMRP